MTTNSGLNRDEQTARVQRKELRRQRASSCLVMVWSGLVDSKCELCKMELVDRFDFICNVYPFRYGPGRHPR